MIEPLRLFKSPMTAPVNSSGTRILTFMIGSNKIGRTFVIASLKAKWAAILNAISLESTSWYLPSNNVVFTFTILYPAKGPFWQHSRRPVSTAGKYCLGTAPPNTFSANTISSSSGLGLNSTNTCPNCPCPPDCFLWRPSPTAVFVMVSR